VLDRAYQPADEIKIVIGYQTIRPLIKGLGLNGAGGLNFIKPTTEDPTRPRTQPGRGKSGRKASRNTTTIGFRVLIIRMISSLQK